MPSLNDQVPGAGAAFSWRSVRGSADQGPRFFEDTRWRGLLWILLAAGFFAAAVLFLVVR